MGGGPDGRPRTTDFSPISFLGAAAMVLLPEFSGAPAEIQVSMSAMSGSGILGLLGGMKGSALCATVVNSDDFSGSPGFTTAPELPPSISLV